MNLTAILFQYSIIGLLALGQLLVILTAGIDLSQGSRGGADFDCGGRADEEHRPCSRRLPAGCWPAL